VVFVWLYAGFWATMPLVGWGSYAPEPFGTSCTLDWWLAQASVAGQSFVIAILFFCLIFPTGIIVFSYVMIIFKVKSSAKEISHFDTRNKNSHNLEMKLTKVCVCMCQSPEHTLILSPSPTYACNVQALPYPGPIASDKFKALPETQNQK
jgi:G0-opsin